MDLKKYDELRKKIQTKDFEGKNKNLDYWLYRLSFLGNIGSIFFAYFLVLPALNKAITLNLVSGSFGLFLAIITTIVVLVSFELIKRILIKNLSFDMVKSKMKFNSSSIWGWFIFSVAILIMSFYFSLNGAKNFASTSDKKNTKNKTELIEKVDSINQIYELKVLTYDNDNNSLRENNNTLRNELAKDKTWRISRIQESIDKNNANIERNEKQISQIEQEKQIIIDELKEQYKKNETTNSNEDNKSILLFILISTSIEILIIIGLFFREYYDYNLYVKNKDKLERVYEKRDRYKVILSYLYREGKVGAREKVMAANTLVELIEENTSIPNPKKFIEIFLRDMEDLGIFVVEGKRRLTNVGYDEAMQIVQNFDDALRMLKFLK
jgi:hypothetical protein